MDLLELARGPLLTVSFLVFLSGCLWRLLGVLRRPTPMLLSPVREHRPRNPRLGAIFRHMLPRRGQIDTPTLVAINPYLFHVGLAIIVFGFLPHIAYLQQYIGFAWPALPNVVMVPAIGITIVSLLLALFMRVTNRTLRRLSGPDDYISWGLVFLIVISGMVLIGGYSSDEATAMYPQNRSLIAVHLLAFELMLLWFPFGKLFHAVSWIVGRSQWGAFIARRGVKG